MDRQLGPAVGWAVGLLEQLLVAGCCLVSHASVLIEHELCLSSFFVSRSVCCKGCLASHIGSNRVGHQLGCGDEGLGPLMCWVRWISGGDLVFVFGDIGQWGLSGRDMGWGVTFWTWLGLAWPLNAASSWVPVTLACFLGGGLRRLVKLTLLSSSSSSSPWSLLLSLSSLLPSEALPLSLSIVV